MRTILSLATFACLCLAVSVMWLRAEDKPAADDPLAEDLKLLQGKWELFHGDDGKGGPTLHSVKEIKGNRETLRRYDVKTEKVLREHSVDLALTASGSVRVCTFYAVDGDPKNGASFVYKVDAENFYDVPGLLQGDTYRNYQDKPSVWHWKKVKETK